MNTYIINGQYCIILGKNNKKKYGKKITATKTDIMNYFSSRMEEIKEGSYAPTYETLKQIPQFSEIKRETFRIVRRYWYRKHFHMSFQKHSERLETITERNFSDLGPTVGLIGSLIMLIAIILRLASGNFYTFNVLLIISVVFSFLWPVLGITGASLGYSGKNKLGGYLLLISGIGGFVGLIFGLGASMMIDLTLMIIGGLLCLNIPFIKLTNSEKSNRKTWGILLLVIGFFLIIITIFWVPRSFYNELAITNPLFPLLLIIGITSTSLGIALLLNDYC